MAVDRLVVDGLGRLPQFSHAGLTDELIFVSGTLGTTEGFTLAEGGIGPETTQTLHNIERILVAAGAGWDDVVKVSVYVADMVDFGAMNDAYGAFFTGTPPARITVGGASLALGATVEIECIARRRPASGTSHALPARETGFVDHDGERIYYDSVGEAGDVPLVLSHGLGGNHAVWYQQVASFARTRRVITWDHRGFGRSSDGGGRSAPDVAVGDLLAVLDHLGVDRADLVGQSMGGWTVAGVALTAPERVRGLVLADTLGGITSDAIAAALAAPRAVEASPLGGTTLGLHPALDAGFSAREPERAHLYQSLGQMGAIDATDVISRVIATTHTAEEAAAITCPVLCIVGSRDPLFPPAAVRELAALLPQASLAEVPGSGHSPYFEDPETWNRLVDRFLTTL